MNTVNLVGRVTKEPTVNNNVTTLIVATDRVKLREGKSYIDPETGYPAKETEFHKVTCFGGLARAAETRSKGDVVAVTGSLHYTSWEGNDGIKRYGCEIRASQIDFF